MLLLLPGRWDIITWSRTWILASFKCFSGNALVPSKVGGVANLRGAKKYVLHEPESVEQQIHGQVMDKEEKYNFLSYVFMTPGIHKVQLFQEASTEALAPQVVVPVKAKFVQGVVAPS